MAGFEFNGNADNAVFDNQTAGLRLGVPNAYSTALPTNSGVTQDAAQAVQAARAKTQAMAQQFSQQPQQAPEPVVGVNFGTMEVLTGGGSFNLGNLTETDAAIKKGMLQSAPQNLPQGFQQVKASEITNYLQREAQNRGFGSSVKEVGRNLLTGTVSGIPDMAGKALQFASPEGSTVADAGAGLRGAAQWTQNKLGGAPDTYGRGAVSTAFIEAANNLPASAAGMAASLAAPWAGVPAVIALYGGSQAQETYEAALAKGLDKATAMEAALKTGGIEGIGEAIADVVGGRLLLGGGKMLRALTASGKMSAEEAAKIATDPKMLSHFAKSMAATYATEGATEFGQQYGEAAVEKSYGIRDADPLQEGLHGAGVAAAMTTMLGPFGALAHHRNAQARAALGKALDNPDNPVDMLQAAQVVRGQIEPMVGQEEANRWMNGRNDLGLQSAMQGLGQQYKQNFVSGIEGLAPQLAEADVGPFPNPVAQYQMQAPRIEALDAGVYAPTSGRKSKKYGPQIEVDVPVGPVQMPQMEGLTGMQSGGYETLVPQATPAPEQPPQKISAAEQRANENASSEGNIPPVSAEERLQRAAEPRGEEHTADERQVVQDLLGQLTDEQRRVLTAYNFEKRTFDDIAAENKTRNPNSWGTKARAQQIHAQAKKRLLKFGQQYGLTPEKLDVYFPNENNSLQGGADVQTVSAAEVGQSGAAMHTPGEADRQTHETEDVSVEPLTGDSLEFGDAGAFDEDSHLQRGEAEGYSDGGLSGVSLNTGTNTVAGKQLTQADIDAALREWEELDGTELPQEYHVKWAKLFVANDAGVLSDNHFQEAYLELSNEIESRKVQHVAEEPAGKSKPASADGAAIGADVREDHGAPAESEISAQGVIDRWNKGAKALGLPSYEQLDSEHQDYLQGSGTWAEFDEAAAEISDEINNAGTPTFSETESKTKGSTAAEVTARLKKLFFSPEKFGKLVTVVQTEADLPDTAKSDLSQAKGKVQGFVGTDGKIYLIANNIAANGELGVFLHEVGVHLGMEKLIGAANMARLVSQIAKWAADTNNKSLEAQLARAAIARAEKSSSENKREELVAYFIEGAVNAGIDPTAVQKMREGALKNWFRTLWAAAKVALRKLSLGRLDQLTAQNLVDLAYGAAKLEMTGTWHGTAADFRNFNHEYMGSGEGAQAFGWGTYLAQRPGIAKGYWKDDVNRKRTYRAAKDDSEIGLPLEHFIVKPEGSLMRVDTAVHDDEMLDWDKPLSEQSDVVKSAMAAAFSATGLSDHHETAPRLKTEGRKRVHWQTGEEAYVALARHLGSDKAASEYLDSIGIKGIKFLDSQSRSTLPDVKFVGNDNLGRNRYLKDFIVYMRRTNGDFAAAVQLMRDKFDVPVGSPKRDIVSTAVSNFLSFVKQSDFEVTQPSQTRNLVIFNAKNVQRVMTEVGASPDKIKFSEATEAISNGVRMFAESRPVSNTWEGAKSFGLKLLNLHQLAEMFPKVPAVQSFVQNLKALSNRKQNLRQQGDAIARAIGNRTGDSRARLSNAFFKMTVGGLQTKTEFDKEGNPSGVTATDEKSKAVLATLSAEERKVYAQAKHEIYTLRQALLKSVEQRIKESGGEAPVVLDTIRKALNGRADYFPLKRFGDYFVSFESAEYKAAVEAGDTKRVEALKKDPAHFWFNTFESRGEAKAFQRANPGSEMSQRQDYMRSTQAVPAAFLNQLTELTKDDKVLHDQIVSLYLQSLPEFAASKHAMRRSGAEGYDKDARRVFSSYVEQVTSAIARNEYADRIRQDVADAQKAAREQGTTDSNMNALLADTLAQHYEALVSPKEAIMGPLQSAMTKLSYIWYLGVTPSFALTNLAQGQMISVPVIAARLGIGNVRASVALYRAMKDAFGVQKQWLGEATGNMFQKVVDSGPQFVWDKAEGRHKLDLSKAKLAHDEKTLIQHLYDQSIIDLNQSLDLVDISHGESEKVRAAMKAATVFAHHSEVLNRLSTGLAAYRLARESGHADPKAFAYKILLDTHFDYAGDVAPLAFKPGYNPLARVMFQFRKYQQAMLYLLVRNTGLAVKGDKAAQRTLVGLAMTHGIFAGTLGLPAVNALASLIAHALGDGDDPWDETRVKAEYRNFLKDHLGKDAAEVVAHGIFRVPGVRDVAPQLGQKLGTEAIADLNRSSSFGAKDAKSGLFQWIGSLVAGPTGGLVGGMAQAFDFFGKGETERGIEMMTPKFIRDQMKAYRFGTEGVTDSKAVARVGADKISPVDQFWQAVGYTPANALEYYESNSANVSHNQALMDHRQKLVTMYANAKQRGDTERAAEVRDELIRKFNEAHPTDPIRAKDLIAADKQRMREVIRLDQDTGAVKDPRHPSRSELGGFANIR